jgi:cysteine desulfurase
VAAIVGFATALAQSVSDRGTAAARAGALRDRLLTGACEIPGVQVTGPWALGDVSTRLAGNAHLVIPDCAGDTLLYLLDAAGVECSTGSACQAGVPQPSHVLLAMGLTAARSRGALRVTLGHTSTEADVDAFLAVLPAAVERAQRADAASRHTAAS